MSDKLTNRTPENLNQLYNNKWKFIINRLPDTEFFCNEVELPNISIKTLNQSTPFNNLNLGGNKVEFGDFRLKFIVSEDLKNYIEIANWIISIGSPYDASKFRDLIASNTLDKQDNYNIYTDGTLFTLTNSNNYNIKVIFHDLFPFSLSSLSFSLTDNTVLNAEVSFKYNYYSIRNDL